MAKRRRIGSAGDPTIENIVLIGGLAVGAYFLIKGGLGNLFGGDPVSNAAINAQMNVTAAQNPFNYQFQPWVNFYNNNAPNAASAGSVQMIPTEWYDPLTWFASATQPGATATGAPLDMGTFFTQLDAELSANSSAVSSPWATVDAVNLGLAAQSINDLSSMFSNANTTMATAFANVTSQIDCAFIAAYTYYVYGRDLLTRLNGGPITGTTPANLAGLIAQINALPVGG